LLGYIIKYLLDRETIHDQPYYFYWIIVDSQIMFFSLAYNYMSQLMRQESEVIKNIYTLYFVQTKRLANREIQRRKEELEGSDCSSSRIFSENIDSSIEEKNEEIKFSYDIMNEGGDE
jgi:hypothetical protein